MIVAAVLLGALATAAAAPPPKVYASATLPILVDGGDAKPDRQKVLVRTIRFGAPGVWYLWIKASAGWPHGAVVRWDLDGRQPLHSGRARLLVPPFGGVAWLNQSMLPLHRASVHVDRPGEHTLRIWTESGEAKIERVALTLYFSAKPAGETLDHAGDPGGGRAEFPVAAVPAGSSEGPAAAVQPVDGFREGWTPPPLAATRRFYVDDAKGDDAAPGTSPGRAWRTLARVNAAPLLPGDAVLLRRGGAWDEGVRPRGSGTAARPITLGAYGEGPRPRINGGNRHAVHLQDRSWWTVQDLEVTSDPLAGRCGVQIESVEGRPAPRGFHVYNVVAYDNGGAGIRAGPSGEKDNGCDGVHIENCLAFCNGGDGIGMHGNDQNGCRNGVIRFCTAWENRGGGGIYYSGGQNGLIERCVAYNNIIINIWAWNAINITMRRCEAWRGHEADAGGFDIDWSCEASTMEYCYAHHNEGVGFLLQGSGWIDYRGFPMQSRYNLMRYCISEHDGGSIGMVETFEFGKVHNNLAICRRPNGEALGIGGWPEKPWDWYADAGGWPSDTEFTNNLLLGVNGGTGMLVDDYATRQRNRFDHNLYHVAGGAPLINWGGRQNGPRFWWGDPSPPGTTFPPESYRDLAAFRKATGQEAHGLAADPRLEAPGEGGYGRLPLAAYRLKPGSPALRAGRPVPLEPAWLAARAKYLTKTGAEAWGIPMAPAPATEDYWGRPVDPAMPSIGPYQ